MCSTFRNCKSTAALDIELQQSKLESKRTKLKKMRLKNYRNSFKNTKASPHSQIVRETEPEAESVALLMLSCCREPMNGVEARQGSSI